MIERTSNSYKNALIHKGSVLEQLGEENRMGLASQHLPGKNDQ